MVRILCGIVRLDRRRSNGPLRTDRIPAVGTGGDESCGVTGSTQIDLLPPTLIISIHAPGIRGLRLGDEGVASWESEWSLGSGWRTLYERILTDFVLWLYAAMFFWRLVASPPQFGPL
jgi:hypothetical protein